MCKDILTEYLQERGRGSLVALAEASGLSKGHIHDLKSGKLPTVATARKLEAATGIRAAVWLGLEQPKRRAKA